MAHTIVFAPSPLVKIFPLIIAGMLVNPKTGRVEYQPYVDVYYVVVIDAGASGSRVHAYKFSISEDRHKEDAVEKIHLEDELYVATNPGLSYFVDDPEKGAESIVNLVNAADNLVPKDKRAVTPLVVRATSAVRSMPADLANDLIDHVYRAVSKLEYKVHPSYVRILKETDEAIYTWYAINLLTNNLGKDTTMSSLELGGISARLTYELEPFKIDKYSRNDVYVRPAVFDTTLFSHSFIGQGIGTARYGTLQLEAGGNTSSTKNYKSVCFDPSVENYKANFFGQHVEIRQECVCNLGVIDEEVTFEQHIHQKFGRGFGVLRCLYSLRSGISRENLTSKKVYSRCLDIVQPYVHATVKDVSVHGAKHIAATGYYYILANREGLIQPEENGMITIKALKEHALSSKGGCAISDKNRPWRCFDAVYVVSLLEDGYGIDENSVINLYNDIDGYGVEWSLGLAYNYVMSSIAEKQGTAHIYAKYITHILHS